MILGLVFLLYSCESEFTALRALGEALLNYLDTRFPTVKVRVFSFETYGHFSYDLALISFELAVGGSLVVTVEILVSSHLFRKDGLLSYRNSVLGELCSCTFNMVPVSEKLASFSLRDSSCFNLSMESTFYSSSRTYCVLNSFGACRPLLSLVIDVCGSRER